MLSRAVKMIEESDVLGEQSSEYLGIIQSLIDFQTAICFTWFHVCSNGQNPVIRRAYDRLSIHYSTSNALRESVKHILDH